MILGITTTTPRCSVALLDEDGNLLGEESYEDEMNHAERLFPTLEVLFTRAGRPRTALTRVACDVGPGSFTGVRVGLASAKGVALGLGVPLVGVGSLEAMCAAALHRSQDAAIACALLDAKRGETFVGAYDRGGAERLAPRHTKIGEAAQLIAGELTESVVFCGRAAEREGVSPILSDTSCSLPSATWVARIAAQRPVTTTVDAIEPVYVRAPDAKPMAIPPTAT